MSSKGIRKVFEGFANSYTAGMELPRSRAALPEVIWLEEAPSTNQSLRELRAARPDAPHGTAIATATQTAGRGRLGREWATPSGTALAVSFLIRDVSIEGTAGALGVGWLPLLAGSAVAAAVRVELPGARVAVKWPNDVHVFDLGQDSAERGGIGRKICGILCELLPGFVDGAGDAIVGAGVNLLISRDALPTERATSLAAEGAPGAVAATVDDPAGAELLDRVLAAAGTELLRLARLAQTDADAARARVIADSATLGAHVRAHLPGGEVVQGLARALAADGSLIVEREEREPLTVSAGDVEHLR